jgi:Fic family protein
MNITKIVSLLEQVEDSIHNEDFKKATDIIGYLIDDIIKFEMAHEEDFKMIHDVIMKIRGNNDEIGRARMLSGDIVGEA